MSHVITNTRAGVKNAEGLARFLPIFRTCSCCKRWRYGDAENDAEDDAEDDADAD